MAKSRKDLTEEQKARHHEASQKLKEHTTGSGTTRVLPPSSKVPSDKSSQPRKSGSKSKDTSHGSVESTRPKTAGKAVSSLRPMVNLEAQFKESTLGPSDDDSDTGHRKTGGKSVYHSRRPAASHADPPRSGSGKSPNDSSDDSDQHRPRSHAHRKRSAHGRKSVPGWEPPSHHEDDDIQPHHSSVSVGSKRHAQTPPTAESKRPREHEPRAATPGPSTSATNDQPQPLVAERRLIPIDGDRVKCSNCGTSWMKSSRHSIQAHFKQTEFCSRIYEHQPKKQSEKDVLKIEATMREIARKDFICETKDRGGRTKYECRVCRDSKDHITYNEAEKHVRDAHFCFDPVIKTSADYPAECSCKYLFGHRRHMNTHYQSGICPKNRFELEDLVTIDDDSLRKKYYRCAPCGREFGAGKRAQENASKHIWKNECKKCSHTPGEHPKIKGRALVSQAS
jgi:hypothetical protein